MACIQYRIVSHQIHFILVLRLKAGVRCQVSGKTSSSVLHGRSYGTGPDVKVTDNGATVVLGNGIVTATITKLSAAITNLTYNGANLLSGGNNGGQVYWSWNMPNYQNPSGCTYILSGNPSANNGDYAEIMLQLPEAVPLVLSAMQEDYRLNWLPVMCSLAIMCRGQMCLPLPPAAML